MHLVRIQTPYAMRRPITLFGATADRQPRGYPQWKGCLLRRRGQGPSELNTSNIVRSSRTAGKPASSTAGRARMLMSLAWRQCRPSEGRQRRPVSPQQPRERVCSLMPSVSLKHNPGVCGLSKSVVSRSLEIHPTHPMCSTKLH